LKLPKVTIEYPDGNKYKGEVLNDTPHGEGVATSPDDGKYVDVKGVKSLLDPC
jgi:hypothetical protein